MDPISPRASQADVSELAEQVVHQVVVAGIKDAMVMGEYSMTIELVRQLSLQGVRCFVACFENGHEIEERGDQRLKVRPFVRFREVTHPIFQAVH